MMNTVEKVAESGGETLKTVDENQKVSIIGSVETLADTMAGWAYLS